MIGLFDFFKYRIVNVSSSVEYGMVVSVEYICILFIVSGCFSSLVFEVFWLNVLW